MDRRRPVDVAAYIRETREGACFVCRIVRGEAMLPNPIVFESDHAIAWVNPYQVLLGYTLVAPKSHREDVTGDFTRDEYLALQAVVHQVGEAVRRAVPTERLYVLSLGSREGNRHVHWHLAPLPPGVPYEEQQLEALRLERACSIFQRLRCWHSRGAFGPSSSRHELARLRKGSPKLLPTAIVAALSARVRHARASEA